MSRMRQMESMSYSVQLPVNQRVPPGSRGRLVRAEQAILHIVMLDTEDNQFYLFDP
jgi:hypothetical protein